MYLNGYWWISGISVHLSGTVGLSGSQWISVEPRDLYGSQWILRILVDLRALGFRSNCGLVAGARCAGLFLLSFLSKAPGIFSIKLWKAKNNQWAAVQQAERSLMLKTEIWGAWPDSWQELKTPLLTAVVSRNASQSTVMYSWNVHVESHWNWTVDDYLHHSAVEWLILIGQRGFVYVKSSSLNSISCISTLIWWCLINGRSLQFQRFCNNRRRQMRLNVSVLFKTIFVDYTYTPQHICIMYIML